MIYKRLLSFIFLLFFSVSLLYSAKQSDELRAVWVSTTARLDWPKTGINGPTAQKSALTAIFEKAKDANFNAIFFQVRTECDAFYNSAYEPWSRFLNKDGEQGVYPGYDPLQFAIDEADRLGLELHAWLNPYRINTDKSAGTNYFDDGHVYSENPSWAINYTSGEDAGLKILNPGHPNVTPYIVSVVEDIITKYDVDGVVFDDYFYSYYGTPSSLDADEYSSYGGGLSLEDWRRKNINEMIAAVYTKIGEVDPDMVFGVSPFGVYKNGEPVDGVHDAYGTQYCDPIAWLNAGNVDYLSPQIYWGVNHNKAPFETVTDWWADKTNGKNCHLYVSIIVDDLPTLKGSKLVNQNFDYSNYSFSNIERQGIVKNEKTNGSAATTLAELGQQVDIVRSYNAENSLGCIYFRADLLLNTTGAADYLKTNKYTQFVQPPVMSWKVNAPTAKFSINGLPAESGDTVSFDPSLSTDNGSIVSYFWNFGDGESLTTTADTVIKHVYTVDKIYDVLLKVTDNEGYIDSIVQKVEISSCEPPAETDIIMDSENVGAENIIGEWATSTYVSGYLGSNYKYATTTPSGKQVIYTPDIVQGGNYEVFFLSVTGSLATNTPVEINYLNGNDTKYVDQTNSVNNGEWVSLGTYPFSSGTLGNVIISNNDADGTVVADGIKFSFEGCAAAPEPITAFKAIEQTTYAGLSVSFIDTSENDPYEWKWIFEGGTPAVSTLQNPTVLYSSAGTYDVTLIAKNGSGSDTLLKADYITVLSVAEPDFIADVTEIGEGGIVTFSGTTDGETPESWSWTFEGGTPETSTDQNPVVSYTNSGVFDVALTVTFSTGNKASISKSKSKAEYIKVYKKPQAGFEVNKTTVAEGSSVNFTDTSANEPTSWEWIFEGGNPSTSTDQNPLVTYANNGLYDVTLIAGNPAGKDTIIAQNNIKVIANPIAGFKANATLIGESSSVIFTDTSLNEPTAWEWFFEGGTPETSTIQNPTVTYSASGTYTVKLIAKNLAGNDTVTKNDLITVVSSPVAGFDLSSQTIAEGGEVTFSDTSLNDPTSWEWTFEGGTPSTSTDQNPVVIYANSGTYNVSLKVTNPAGSNSTLKTNLIKVVAVPIAGFLPSSTTIAEGGTVLYTDTSLNEPTSWEWIFEGGSPSTSTDNNPTITYENAGIYSITLKAANIAGQDTRTETDLIKVIAEPVAGFISDKTNILAGENVVFTDTSLNEPTTWEWTFEGGTPASSTEQNPTVTYTKGGVFNVALKVSNIAGSNTKAISKLITVTKAPVAGFYSNKKALQIGNQVIFTDTSLNSPSSWSWTFEGGEPLTSLDQNPTVTYNSAGKYSVSLTVENAAGTNTKTINEYIDVYEETLAPIAGFKTDKNFVAKGESVQFFDTSVYEPTAWEWTFEGGTPITSSEQDPLVIYNTVGTFAVTLIAKNSADTDGDTITIDNYITVKNLPVANFTSNKTEVIVGEDVLFIDTSQHEVTSWEWYFEGGQPSVSTNQNPIVNYDTEGVYSVKLIAKNSVGTDTLLIDDYISVIKKVIAPVAYFTANKTEVIEGNQVSFMDTSINEPTSWQWTFEGGIPATSVNQNPVITYNVPGTYKVLLKVGNSAGSYTLTKQGYITVVKDVIAPVAGFDVNTFEIFEEDQVVFTDTSLNEPTTWAWTFEGGIPATSADKNPVVTYALSGSYSVSLVVSNTAGSNEKTVNKCITVHKKPNPPTAYFAANVTNIVAGGQIYFTDTSISEPTSWEWMFEGGTPEVSAEQSPVVVYNTPGIYQVSLKVANQAGSSALVKEDYITVIEDDKLKPDAGFVVNERTILEGNQVLFIDTSLNEPTAWEWTFEGGEPSVSTDQYPRVFYNNKGVYSVQLIATNSAGADTVNFEDYITVNGVVTAPIAYFFADVTEIVEGGQVSFTDTSANEPTSWEWTFDGGTPATSTEQNPVVNYSACGVYNVTLKVVNSGGSYINTKEEYITVLKETIAPIAGFTVNSNETYEADNVVFTDTSLNEPTSWEWTFEGGEPSISTEQNPIVKYNNEGVFSVKLIAINSAGSDTVAFENYITVKKVVSVPVAYFTANTTEVFENEQVSFIDTSINQPTSWEWFFEGGTPESSNEQNPVITYLQAGAYNVSLKVSNSAGSYTQTKTEYILVNEKVLMPLAGFTADTTEIIEGDTVSFIDTSLNEPTGWEWTFEGGYPEVSTEQNPKVIYVDTGVYSVSLKVFNIAGYSEILKEKYVTVNMQEAAPVAYFTSDSVEIFEGSSVSFTDTSLNNPTGWEWFFEGGIPEISTDENPVIIYPQKGYFTVKLIVKNNYGSDTLINKNYIKVNDYNIVEGDKSSAISLYPNPNSGKFYITLPKSATSGSIMILHIDGSLLHIQKFNNVINGTILLDLGDIKPGIYFVRISDSFNVETVSKMIVK